VRDRAAADAAVHGGGGGGGQFAGEGTDHGGVHVAGPGDGFGGEVPYGFAEFVEPLEVLGQLAGLDEVFLEQHVCRRREQQGIRARPDRDVPVCELGGAGAARVDDGEGAAAGLERLELAGEVGGGAQTPVGLQGVGADEEQVVGAVEVGHGDRVGVAVEQPAGDVLGHLVDRGRGEEAAGAEAREQHRRVEGAGHGVHVGVAEDDADGVRAVPLHDGAQACRDRVERLLPGGLAQFAVLADEGGAQPVGVAVDGAEGGTLRADEPAAEHVLAVTAGPGDPGAVDGEGQPAGGLAQGADSQGGAGHGSSRWSASGSGDARTGTEHTDRYGRRGVPSGGGIGNRRRVRSPSGFSPARVPDTPAASPAPRR
jgi:hypothetical protein